MTPEWSDEDRKFLTDFFFNLIHGDFMADNPKDLSDALRAQTLILGKDEWLDKLRGKDSHS